MEKQLKEIASYKYKCFSFGYVFMAYDYGSKDWHIVWRNPLEFSNTLKGCDTPEEACEDALKFIKANP